MKSLTKYIVTVILVLLVTGHGTTSREIRAKTESIRSDVFREIAEEGVSAVNSVDLLIRTHIKTHLVGYYVLESADSLNGKPGYPFMFNINGQGVVWKVIGVKEETARYDEKGKRIAEGGSRHEI